MSPSKPLHYWDSCTFLAVLKNEHDKIEECLTVLRAAQERKLLIVTSALTFIEVIKLEKGQPKLTREVENKIRDFFKHDWIVIRDVDRPTGELARELMWQHEALRPKDSVHVATAVRHQTNFLDTFDEDLIKLSGMIGNPPLIIQRPFFSTQLKIVE